MNENSVILISLFWFFLGSSVVAGFMDASLYCWIFAAISALFLLSVIQTPMELTVSISHMTSKTLISKTDDGYTFSISPYGDGYRLSVSPENRHNGTQSFDGWFPRFFSEPQYAKSSLTKFLGESLVWEEDSSNAL
ncbi:hypothetical protein [Salmonella enterica]|uniref:hypothetical protein n=1 Tax=Salmonella enterica TaxID=28901 RepID=UPI000B19FF9B|nr:hypothetical protein [Salmonella enterica]